MISRSAFVGKIDEHFPRAIGSLRKLRSGVRRFLARDLIASNRRELLEGEPWEIDEISLDSNRISVVGWGLPAPGGMPRIELNPQPFQVFENHRREDVGTRFWQRARAADSGFAASNPMSGVFESDYASLSYANAPSRLHGGLRRDFYFLDP